MSDPMGDAVSTAGKWRMGGASDPLAEAQARIAALTGALATARERIAALEAELRMQAQMWDDEAIIAARRNVDSPVAKTYWDRAERARKVLDRE